MLFSSKVVFELNAKTNGAKIVQTNDRPFKLLVNSLDDSGETIENRMAKNERLNATVRIPMNMETRSTHAHEALLGDLGSWIARSRVTIAAQVFVTTRILRKRHAEDIVFVFVFQTQMKVKSIATKYAISVV